jgi:hypothetical protein
MAKARLGLSATTTPAAEPESALAAEGLDYCERLSEAAGAAAAAAGGPVDLDLEIAGIVLRLRFAGKRLADLFGPPLRHRQIGGETHPDYTLEVFESAVSGVEAPPPPWERLPPGEGGQAITRYQDRRVSILLESRDRTATAFDRSLAKATMHVPDAEAFPADERDTRLRYPLQIVLGAAGRPMIHAGLVGVGDTGILLPGPTGSGKSTLAVAAAREGMDFCSDDYIVLEPSGNRAHALISTTKLARDSAERLGLVRDEDGRERSFGDRGLVHAKATIDVREIAPSSFRPKMRVAAVAVPRIGGGEACRAARIPPAAALRALAPTTIVQQPSRDPGLLRAMARVVASVPCHDLELSTDPAVNARALRGLLPG